MAKLKVSCGNCGRDVFMDVNQHVIYDTVLVWSGSYACPYCGAQIEMDGRDDLPEDARNAILAEQGTWALDVNETGFRRVQVLKILREAFNLSMDAIAEYKRNIPGTVVTGTRAEMERLRRLLLAEKLESSVQKIT